MHIASITVDSVSNAAYYIRQLNEAINTKYLPYGETIEEVIEKFTKLQLSRQFTPGYSSANLRMEFSEGSIIIDYSSTSNTTVQCIYFFNDDMEVSSVEINAWLPDYRIGGNHYNSLTQVFYNYDWHEDRKIKVPVSIQKLNEEDMHIPTPKWMLERMTYWFVKEKLQKASEVLGRKGWQPVESPIYEAVWVKDDLALIYSGSNDDRNFAIVSKGSRPDYWSSFWQVIKTSNEDQRVSSMRAKRRKRMEDLVDYQEEDLYTDYFGEDEEQ